jgi:methionine synthase II (cobalamin-independent)
MFATLLGPYPRPADGDSTMMEQLQQILGDQVAAGLGMVTDGEVRTPLAGGGPADIAAIVEAWELADDTLRDLVESLEPGIEPPLVKACLVGPFTAGATATGGSRARAGRPSSADLRRATLAAADMTRAVATALFQAGAPVVQLAEDELTTIGSDDYGRRALAAEALQRATAGVTGHLSLSVAGGNADLAGPSLFFDAPFASYSFDLISGPDNWRLITQAPKDRGIICGVADARADTPDDEPVMVWAARYAASSQGRGLERVGLAPSAGLERLPRAVAQRKLQALSEAARKAGLVGPELAAAIDPRAVDARSAALGVFDPDAARPLFGRSRRPSAPSGEHRP